MAIFSYRLSDRYVYQIASRSDIITSAVTSLLLIKFLSCQVVARKPYLIQTLSLALKQTDDLTCGILPTLFQLKFRQLLWCNSDFNYIGSVMFYQFYKFIHISYQNIGKKLYRYTSNHMVHIFK